MHHSLSIRQTLNHSSWHLSIKRSRRRTSMSLRHKKNYTHASNKTGGNFSRSLPVHIDYERRTFVYLPFSFALTFVQHGAISLWMMLCPSVNSKQYFVPFEQSKEISSSMPNKQSILSDCDVSWILCYIWCNCNLQLYPLLRSIWAKDCIHKSRCMLLNI